MSKKNSEILEQKYSYSSPATLPPTHLSACLQQRACGFGGVFQTVGVKRISAAKDTLKNSGITDLFQNKTGTGVRKTRHKLMTKDDKITIIGSFNRTGKPDP